jgi:purine-cytosine permease-like protein
VTARHAVTFAAWFAAAMSPAALWVVTGHALPPWWLILAVGLGVFAAVEVGGRVWGRGRRRK